MTAITDIPDPASLRVRVLPEHVARKIAAGEVIDRPHAVVRELLDNAVDSGADEITLSLEGGGIDSVSVTDNGCGMTPEDLAACWLPHATSKIVSVDDLEMVRTLGFRGEALSSMAACARLEIITSRGGTAQKLTVHGGKLLDILPHRGAPGTTVTVRDLFFNMPARRRFLKSVRGETTMCRKVYLEKAAAHPGIAFRLFVDGIMKSYLPAGSHLERIQSAWPGLAPPGSWWETDILGDGFGITTVHPRPEISRKDRQYIQIYANRRRIDEFALVQGVQHAYDQWMPGGTFPMAFVFIEIDPSLVDFNIHPAKKEARFRDLPSVRHRLIDSLKDRITSESYRKRAGSEEDNPNGLPLNRDLEGFTASEVSGNYRPGNTGKVYKTRPSHFDAGEFGHAAERIRTERHEVGRLERSSPSAPLNATDFRYLGQVMGVFLVAENSGSLFIVDQHAAHERILYEKFRDSRGVSERLLIPREIHPEREAGIRLELRVERLASLGIEVDAEGDRWFLRALPGAAAGMEEDVVDFLENGEADAEGLEKALWADLACKAAVKDNSVLDDQSARRLLTEAFALETPRCPHGRPIWFEVSRRELFELVGRIV